jgi:hypothetical protein
MELAWFTFGWRPQLPPQQGELGQELQTVSSFTLLSFCFVIFSVVLSLFMVFSALPVFSCLLLSLPFICSLFVILSLTHRVWWTKLALFCHLSLPCIGLYPLRQLGVCVFSLPMLTLPFLFFHHLLIGLTSSDLAHNFLLVRKPSLTVLSMKSLFSAFIFAVQFRCLYYSFYER